MTAYHSQPAELRRPIRDIRDIVERANGLPKLHSSAVACESAQQRDQIGDDIRGSLHGVDGADACACVERHRFDVSDDVAAGCGYLEPGDCHLSIGVVHVPDNVALERFGGGQCAREHAVRCVRPTDPERRREDRLVSRRHGQKCLHVDRVSVGLFGRHESRADAYSGGAGRDRRANIRRRRDPSGWNVPGLSWRTGRH
jgi:hypothetical protein